MLLTNILLNNHLIPRFERFVCAKQVGYFFEDVNVMKEKNIEKYNKVSDIFISVKRDGIQKCLNNLP